MKNEQSLELTAKHRQTFQTFVKFTTAHSVFSTYQMSHAHSSSTALYWSQYAKSTDKNTFTPSHPLSPI